MNHAQSQALQRALLGKPAVAPARPVSSRKPGASALRLMDSTGILAWMQHYSTQAAPAASNGHQVSQRFRTVHMLPEDQVKFESFRLQAGGTSFHATHLPTGVVVGDSPNQQPITARIMELHERLEAKVIELKQSQLKGIGDGCGRNG